MKHTIWTLSKEGGRKANRSASDIKTFVGSRNFDESFDFYVSLGWKVNFDAAISGGNKKMEPP